MTNLEGCQLPCLPRMTNGRIKTEPQSFVRRVKNTLAVPWNYYVKRWLKNFYRLTTRRKDRSETKTVSTTTMGVIKIGDAVRVRAWSEIQDTLDPFKELKGCAFLPEMQKYCGTTQRVLQVMERFLDERDYKVKKVQGVVLLEQVICHGTPVFGRCDRCCFFFWREEWLEKIEGTAS